MNRLDCMTVLLAVVDAGSFSAASRRLPMPLATVSRKISELEGYLKTRLIHRSTRQLALTEAGHAYVAACRRVMDELDEAERAATGEYAAPRGELVVTAPVVFGRLHVVQVVSDFLALYPDITVRLTLGDRVVHLLEEHVDIAVRIGALPDSALVASKAGATRRVVCASPAYLASHGVPIHPSELEHHRCITFAGLTSATSWTFVEAGSPLPVAVRTRLTVNTAEAAIGAALSGLGLTCVLSYQVAEEVSRGTLKIVLEEFEAEPWPISLVHAGQRPLPMKLRAFLDFVTPRLRARMREYGGEDTGPRQHGSERLAQQ